jgi:hypothetical protein
MAWGRADRDRPIASFRRNACDDFFLEGLANDQPPPIPAS